MKKLLFAIILCAGFAASVFGQSNPPLRLQEIDGSPNVLGVTTIKVTNGTLSCSGKVCTITISGGGGGGITIGTTTITSGTNTRILYNNAGVVGEYTVTGTGTTAVLSASPTLTGTVAAAAATFSDVLSLTSTTAANNKITQGAAINIGATSTDGIILQNTTAAAAGAQQYSPRLRLTGQGWKTNATAASQTMDWIIENRPLQFTSRPLHELRFSAQTNGAGYNSFVSFQTNDSDGTNDDIRMYIGRGVSQNNGSFIGGSSSGFIIGFNGTAVAGTSQGSSFDVAQPLVLTTGVGTGFTNQVVLRRLASASLAFGATDAAAPVAQTMSVQNVVAGTSNTAGANWTHIASRGTGTGVGGDYIVQVAPAGSSGSSQNTLVNAFTVKGNGAVQLLSVTFANLPTVANGYLIYCSDCTIASPCASGGSGALAKGINSAWVCN